MPDLIRLGGIEGLAAPKKREDLVRARHAIHVHVSLQRVFELASDEQWSADQLANVLEWELLGLGVDVAFEVCRYLADEFEARDKTATLLVSAETGLAVAQVPEDAIYVPPPVAREGTDQLAAPIPRIKPEIEAAIIRYQNAVAEEPVLLEKLFSRARSTSLQQADGDVRLQVATRSGRTKLGECLRDALPALLRDQRGAIGRLYQKCRINEPVPESHDIHISLTLSGHASMLVADALAMNFRYDVYQWGREQLRAGWGRSLAQAITGVAHKGTRPVEVAVNSTLPRGLLIGPPDLAVMARRLEVLPVVDALATAVTGVMFLEVRDDAYAFDSYESAARWCVDASVRVDLYLDPTTLHPLVFTDLIESEFVAEVLS